MQLVHKGSLARTTEAVNAAFFAATSVPAAERRRAAQYIASRHGKPGAYADTFALHEAERQDGIRLFTGEKAVSAAARHIAGQEACRALLLLKVRDAQVNKALKAAAANLSERVGPVRPPVGSSHWFDPYLGGVYCCGRCSVALWRHVTVGGFDTPDDRLAVGLRCLKSRRKEDHTWAVFPFWYALSALIECPAELARPELDHAAPRLESTLKRRASRSPFGERRQEIARRALALV